MIARGYDAAGLRRYNDASPRTVRKRRSEMPWRRTQARRTGTRKQLSSAIICAAGAPGRCGGEACETRKYRVFQGPSARKASVRRAAPGCASLGTIAGDSKSYRAQTGPADSGAPPPKMRRKRLFPQGFPGNRCARRAIARRSAARPPARVGVSRKRVRRARAGVSLAAADRSRTPPDSTGLRAQLRSSPDTNV